MRSASCYFNSRPSARGDSSFGGSGGGGVISIHAPPRGATADVVARRKQSQKFQFTPLREGRRHGFPSIRASANFNSRPSARGDGAAGGFLHYMHISIHAPPRGATMGCCPPNPFSGDFNSRPSARGDRLLLASACVDCISIHAPPRGATPAAVAAALDALFQFTPLREGRPHGDAVIMPIAPFQFTPLREGRQGARPFCQRRREFQFTPLREGRRLVSDPRCTFLNFNSRPSARGDAR